MFHFIHISQTVVMALQVRSPLTGCRISRHCKPNAA
jgi:hypothetical protein